MDFSKYFSVALKNVRIRLGFNQSQMAHACGIHASTYQNYESGERDPDINVINVLYLKHQVNPAYFFNLELPMFINNILYLSESDKMIVEIVDELKADQAVKKIIHSLICVPPFSREKSENLAQSLGLYIQSAYKADDAYVKDDEVSFVRLKPQIEGEDPPK